MSMDRRKALQATGGFGVLGMFVAAGVITPAQAQQLQWNKAAFEGKDVNSAAKALGGDVPVASDKITIMGPDIAENGAVVPLGASSTLPNVQMIALLVEKNPNALAAVFNLTPDCEPFVTTRVKMGQSSDVYALVKANDKFYMAKKEIKVTLGGCGG